MRPGPLRHKWFAAFTAAIGAAAILRVVHSVPYILFGAPAGALIDRVGKRRLLIACDVAGIAAHGGHSPLRDGGVFSIELLYVIGFLLGSVEVLWGVTTDFSVLPSLVEEHELTDANAIFLAADRAARIVGPTLGGFAIAAIGNVSAMWIAPWPPARADTRVAALLKWAPGTGLRRANRPFLLLGQNPRLALVVGGFHVPISLPVASSQIRTAAMTSTISRHHHTARDQPMPYILSMNRRNRTTASHITCDNTENA